MIRATLPLLLALASSLPSQREQPIPRKPTEVEPGSKATAAPERPQRTSRRKGLQVQVEHGPRFTIPAEWLDWHREHGNTLVTRPSRKHLDPKQAGEWDRQYGTVLDAALPVRDCAFVGGGEAFGKDSVSFGDLQMRVYLLKATPKEVDGLLDTKGSEALRRMLRPHRTPLWLEVEGRGDGDANDELPPLARFQPARKPGQKGPWQQAKWSFDLWFFDYGGRANIDVRTRRNGEHVAVFTFCYAWEKQHAKAIEAILKSVTWPARKGDGK
ncbi:MAG: hypothetical protein ACE37K_10165 [Planctomycetota bacterium]